MDNFNLSLRSTLHTNIKPEVIHKLMGRLKLANFLELPEKEFREFIKNVEEDPLFKQLCYSTKREEKLITYKRYPKADMSKKFYELNEQISVDRTSVDIESLLGEQEEVVNTIKLLGMEKFKRYFLYPEEDLTIPEISKTCELAIAEVEKITELLNKVFVHTEFSVSKPGDRDYQGDPEKQIRYSKIGAIENDGDSYRVGFYIPAFARGRYVISLDKLKALKKNKVYNKKAIKNIEKLLKKLELINARKGIVYQILSSIITIQLNFLKSGNNNDLKPFILKKLAQEIGVSLSTVSRAIHGKSVDTPWGEKPLRYFFPTNIGPKKRLVRQIIEAEKKSLSDEKIRKLIKDKYGIAISRRSINVYRKSMDIGSSYTRARNSVTSRIENS